MPLWGIVILLIVSLAILLGIGMSATAPSSPAAANREAPGPTVRRRPRAGSLRAPPASPIPPASRVGYFPAVLPGTRAVPACVHVRSTPVAAHATSTLDLPKTAGTVSPHCAGAGSARLF